MRILMVILIVWPSLLQGQQQTDYARVSDSFRFADGTIYTLSQPTRWKGKDWMKLGGIVAGTAALTMVDNPIRNYFASHNNAVLDGVNTVGYHYGKPYSALLFTSGFYFSGMLFKSDWAKETGLMLGASLLSAGLLEMTLKPAIGRARPYEEKGNYEMTFFNKEKSFHSFPSGHASMAFTISLVMARRVNNVPVKVLFYSLATSTAVCRLYSDAHWVSDVAFGGAIAWFCSEVAMKRISENRFRKPDSKRFNWQIDPFPSGLSVKATF